MTRANGPRSAGGALPLLSCLAGVAALALAASVRAGAAQGQGPRPVILVGLDGADWQAIEPLAAAGRLPAFARLREAGRTGVLRATPPLVSPIVWTTIATGRPPEEHGVLDFMVDRPSGGQAPVGVAERRVEALWNNLLRLSGVSRGRTPTGGVTSGVRSVECRWRG